jgi:hypothetical protein
VGGCAGVEVPFRRARRLSGDAGRVQRRIVGVVVPRLADGRDGRRILNQHGLLGRGTRAQNARSRGPERHLPGLDNSGPGVVVGRPGSLRARSVVEVAAAVLGLGLVPAVAGGVSARGGVGEAAVAPSRTRGMAPSELPTFPYQLKLLG